MPDSKVSDESRRWLFRLGAWGCTILALAWGATMLLQGPQRYSSTGWSIAMSVGSPLFWGWWVLTGGVLMLLSMLTKNGRLMLVGSLMVSLSVWGRAVAAMLAARIDVTVSWTAPEGWVALAALFMAQGMIHAKAFR